MKKPKFNGEVQQLEGIASQSCNGISRGITRSILTYYDIYFTDATCIHPSSAQPREQKKEITESLLEIYPNPATDYFSLNLNDINRNCTMTVYDITGRSVLKRNIHKNTSAMKVDIDHLSPGLYFYHLQAEGTPLSTGKLIVQ